MENLLQGDNAIYIIAVLSAIIAASESLGSSKKFESNSVLQLVGKIAGGLLKLIKK